jgi:hypothetical protein
MGAPYIYDISHLRVKIHDALYYQGRIAYTFYTASSSKLQYCAKLKLIQMAKKIVHVNRTRMFSIAFQKSPMLEPIPRQLTWVHIFTLLFSNIHFTTIMHSTLGPLKWFVSYDISRSKFCTHSHLSMRAASPMYLKVLNSIALAILFHHHHHHPSRVRPW